MTSKLLVVRKHRIDRGVFEFRMPEAAAEAASQCRTRGWTPHGEPVLVFDNPTLTMALVRVSVEEPDGSPD
ncbi:MAG: hypothetical protein JO214_07625 [Frankiaceae bacterium]|nr:hypothetical protein [Frankiaceae bacterium]